MRSVEGEALNVDISRNLDGYDELPNKISARWQEISQNVFHDYRERVTKTIAQLGAWWEGTDQSLGSTYQPRAGRLVAFVPNAEPWTELQAWNRYWPAFSPAGTGLPDVDIQSAIDLMVGSF